MCTFRCLPGQVISNIKQFSVSQEGDAQQFCSRQASGDGQQPTAIEHCCQRGVDLLSQRTLFVFRWRPGRFYVNSSEFQEELHRPQGVCGRWRLGSDDGLEGNEAVQVTAEVVTEQAGVVVLITV